MNGKHVGPLLLSILACACSGPRAAESPPAAAPPASPTEVISENLPAPNDVAPVLPRVGDRDSSPVAVAFVLDRSGSMTGTPLEMARTATSDAIADLGDADWVSVIAFDGQPITRAGHAHDPAIAEFVAKIIPGGGTEIFTALQAAFTSLKSVAAAKKHVILLTDGQAPTDGLRELAQEMHAAGIGITTVGIGTQVDTSMLEQLASIGGGQFHAVADPSALSQIFTAQVASLVAVAPRP